MKVAILIMMLRGLLACATDVAPTAGRTPPSYPIAVATPSSTCQGNSNPVHWKNDLVELMADDFYIEIDGQKYFGDCIGPLPSPVGSDPGTATYRTLEAAWHEHGIEMRLLMYFKGSAASWWVDEIRTYNGKNPGDWIYYPGAYFKHARGGVFTGDVDIVNVPGPTQARIHFTGLRLRTFELTAAYPRQATPGATLTPIDFPGNRNLPNRTAWLTFSGTGITEKNHGILDRHRTVKPPVMTFAYPPSWQCLDSLGDYNFAYPDQAPLDFGLRKHLPNPPRGGEGPLPGDALINFTLVLTDLEPTDYTSTEPFGFGALGTKINYGKFNGQTAMFADYGDAKTSMSRTILFQVSPGVLMMLRLEFYAEGISPDYVEQTMGELDSVLASIQIN